jgi:hypothetical protein
VTRVEIERGTLVTLVTVVTLVTLVIYSMIKHIVFFKLLKTSSPEDKQLQLKRMEEIFSALRDKFSFIIEYRTGINFNNTESSWDFVIDSVFRNMEDLECYIRSEDHKKAVAVASGIQKTKAVIDYEI